MPILRYLSSPSSSSVIGIFSFRSLAVLPTARYAFSGHCSMPSSSAAHSLSSPNRHRFCARRHSSTIQKPQKSKRSRRRSWLGWLIVGIMSAGAGFYLWDIILPRSRERQDPEHYYTDWKIRLYTSFPWNALSGIIGILSNINLNIWLRRPIYGLYVYLTGCRMDEAAEPELKAYPTFAAFFNRALREGVRPISHSLLVSPADGTVLHYGKVLNGRVEFVKDNDYELHEFLGPVNVDTRAGNALFQLVIYLAPGDYHAFHSPTKWRALEKVHFPGFMLSVRPSMVQWIPKLFCLNERVVLSGQWQHGYFSLSAVAATSVGDIVITNEPVRNRKVLEEEKYSIFDETMSFKPGDKVGEFRLGSTVVLVFEAPENIEFCIHAGDKLQYGQSLVLQPVL